MHSIDSDRLKICTFIFHSDEIRDQIKSLKKEYKNDRKAKEEEKDPKSKDDDEKEHSNELVQQFLSEQRKYSHLKKDMPKKGASR